MPDETRDRPNIKVLLRNLLAMITIYSVIIAIYLTAVLYLLEDPLTYLFQNNLIVYAILALVLIIGQGILLENFTSFLLNQIKLE